MDFVDPAGIKSSFFKLAVHIGGDYEVARRHPLGGFQKKLKAAVGLSVPIEVEPVSIKTPGEGRVIGKPSRIGNRFKRKTEPGKWRIVLPKTTFPAEVRQAGVHAHARTGGNEQSIGISEGVSSGFNRCHRIC